MVSLRYSRGPVKINQPLGLSSSAASPLHRLLEVIKFRCDGLEPIEPPRFPARDSTGHKARNANPFHFHSPRSILSPSLPDLPRFTPKMSFPDRIQVIASNFRFERISHSSLESNGQNYTDENVSDCRFKSLDRRTVLSFHRKNKTKEITIIEEKNKIFSRRRKK